MGIKTSSYKCTAGGASLEHMQSGAGQLQGSRLVTVEEAQAGSLCRAQALAWARGSKRVSGGGHQQI